MSLGCRTVFPRFPPRPDEPTGVPLRFELKSAGYQPISTGLANGVITIELSEADSVKREKI